MLKCNDPKTLPRLRNTENSSQVSPTLNAVRTKDLKTNRHLHPVIPKQPQDLQKKKGRPLCPGAPLCARP